MESGFICSSKAVSNSQTVWDHGTLPCYGIFASFTALCQDYNFDFVAEDYSVSFKACSSQDPFIFLDLSILVL